MCVYVYVWLMKFAMFSSILVNSVQHLCGKLPGLFRCLLLVMISFASATQVLFGHFNFVNEDITLSLVLGLKFV